MAHVITLSANALVTMQWHLRISRLMSVKEIEIDRYPPQWKRKRRERAWRTGNNRNGIGSKEK